MYAECRVLSFRTPTTRARLKTAEFYEARGEEAEERNDFRAAIREYEQALRYDPFDTVALLNVGNCYLRLRKPEIAQRFYERRIELNEEDAVVHRHLGDAFSDQRKYAQAISHYRRAIEIGPHPAAYFNLGAICEFLERYEDALWAYSEARCFDPEDDEMRSAFRRVKEKTGNLVPFSKRKV